MTRVDFAGAVARDDRAPLLLSRRGGPSPKKLLLLLLGVAVFFAAAARIGYAGAGSILVSATVLSKSNCKFDTKSAALAFGALDPAGGVDVTATATIGFRCMGSTPVAAFAITDDDGLYAIAPDANRMRHSTLPAQYLPYGLALTPTLGTVPKNAPLTLTVTGTVRGADYRNAYAGDYSDTVVISIEP